MVRAGAGPPLRLRLDTITRCVSRAGALRAFGGSAGLCAEQGCWEEGENPDRQGSQVAPGRAGEGESEDDLAGAGQRRAEARPMRVAIRGSSSQEDGAAAEPGWRDRTRLVPHPGSTVPSTRTLGHWPAGYTAVTLEPRLRARKHSPPTPGPSDLGFLRHSVARHGFPLMWVCEASRTWLFLTGAIHGPDKACTLQGRHLGPAGMPPPCFLQYLISRAESQRDPPFPTPRPLAVGPWDS